MCQRYMAISRCQPKPCLNYLLFPEKSFPHAKSLIEMLELTMLHLQEYYWKSKTRPDPNYPAHTQRPETLLNRG